jgi:hypothetical protein
MKNLRRAMAHLECNAYAQRFVPDHPVHAEARDAATAYSKAVKRGKARHWGEWQEKLVGDQMWHIHKFLSASPLDGSTTRILTLVQWGGAERQLTASAETDKDKCKWLQAEFFSPQMSVLSVPPDPVYPAPVWLWKPVSDDLLWCVADKMKPYKAMFPESIPNCVIKQCTNLLIPFVGPIFRSLDELSHFPDEWSELRIPVLQKPGKPD